MSLIVKLLIKGLNYFPYVKGLNRRIFDFEKYSGFPPGHYYSPLADPKEYLEQQEKPFSDVSFYPKEIDFNEAEQFEILKSFLFFYSEMRIPKTDTAGFRYSFDNVFFTFSDAISLYCMMRLYRPKKIVEIGSGFSSALILDTNEKYFENNITITFIEPDPKRLFNILKEGEIVNVIQQKIQDTDNSIFTGLEAGDFLLIDTSHVSKSGSDVNHIYFNILPYLKKGVIIHIHDIFFPFEYPEKWVVDEKRSWNEIFIVRSLLAFTNTFKILFFNDYMEKRHRDFLLAEMPLFLERNSTVCGGIWIEKTT